MTLILLIVIMIITINLKATIDLLALIKSKGHHRQAKWNVKGN